MELLQILPPLVHEYLTDSDDDTDTNDIPTAHTYLTDNDDDRFKRSQISFRLTLVMKLDEHSK